jgi:ribosomal RNA-processing protein 8
MFAVPGWSVSSNSLKIQTVDKPKPENTGAPQPDNGEESASKHNKKRKRSGKSKASEVNPANLADLWETVIEGKPKKEKTKKRQKLSNGEGKGIEDGADDNVIAGDQETSKELATAVAPEKDGQFAVPKLEKKKKKKSKKEWAENISNEGNQASDQPMKAMAPPLPKLAAQLTPLQASMRQKLISARFRHLNQTLYTTPSTHSLSLFQDNPEMFTEYHEGFRRQVEVWPENPVDGYIVQIQARGKVRGPQPKGREILQNETALPRTEGTCSIADLGCGDAALSTALQPYTKKLHLKIHSFDLQSPSPLVTKADIANLPLPDNSIDVAIFCLALMGTNWVDFIEEAFRVLRWKGELWIAEIKSRFGRVGKSKVVSHSVGNRKRPLDKKIQKRQEEEAGDVVAAVEVDGHEDRNAETDVSAFVEVLRKRGFVLKGEGQEGESSAIDLSNKMFVRMHFIKGATPIKGKSVPVPKGMEKMGLETWKKKPKGKFIDEDAAEHISSEANVLKPCVYKLR